MSSNLSCLKGFWPIGIPASVERLHVSHDGRTMVWIILKVHLGAALAQAVGRTERHLGHDPGVFDLELAASPGVVQSGAGRLGLPTKLSHYCASG